MEEHSSEMKIIPIFGQYIVIMMERPKVWIKFPNFISELSSIVPPILFLNYIPYSQFLLHAPYFNDWILLQKLNQYDICHMLKVYHGLVSNTSGS